MTKVKPQGDEPVRQDDQQVLEQIMRAARLTVICCMLSNVALFGAVAGSMCSLYSMDAGLMSFLPIFMMPFASVPTLNTN